ncbi:MAG: hypothetical protein HY582_02685 [Candidatus Omnitrophica bacterium]|nr:hypothetical protein [Candidatus Omnitrophota bacterium]
MKPIGEILIEQGSVTKEQLELALEKQKKSNSGMRLGAVLIQMGIVTEADIVQALSTQFNLPYLPLKNVSLSGETCQLVPKELAYKYRFVPIEKMKEAITIASSDSVDEKAMQEIEQTVKLKIQMFLTTMNEIQMALRQCYGEEPAGKEARRETK